MSFLPSPPHIPTPRLTFNCSTLWLLSSTTKIRKSSRRAMLAVGRTELLTSLQRPKPSRPNCDKEFPKPWCCGKPGRTSSMEDRHKTTSCKLGKNFSNSTYRMEIGNLGPTTSKLIIKEFRAWNALTWCFWKGFGMIGHRYRSCRGLGISDPTWKRKNLPHNSCNSTSSHPIWVMCHPKVNFFKLPKTAWKMFQEISNGIPLFPEPL